MHANDPIHAYHPELFPKDFGERLARLAESLGVGRDRVTEWRGGGVPTGGELWHIMRLASSVPGGMEVMLPQKAGLGDGGERVV